MTSPGMENQTGYKATGAYTVKNVPCPFCGLLCDDLEIGRTPEGGLEARRNACSLAKAGFERTLPSATVQVKGSSATLAEAVAAAANLIRSATLPLFGGLATDVAGVRAALSLAERAGGVIDHALSQAQYRNISVLQSSGWITTTLTEVRNRADLLIIAASDVHKVHPRFFERMAAPERTLFGEAEKRTIVFIGEGLDTTGAPGPAAGEVLSLPCPRERTVEVFQALRARLKGAPVSQERAAGIPLSEIDKLADHCRKAKYGVITWVPAEFTFGNASLLVHLMVETVKDLNQKGRFAGLPLGGNEGLTTAASTAAWQTGYPLRVSYASGHPEYDPWRYDISRMLQSGEGDLLVWTAVFSPALVPPPNTSLPLIVLGTPGLTLDRVPEVFIPVGTPGAAHSGSLIRVDSVVSLPLRNPGQSSLPTAAAVLSAIEAAL